MANGADLVGNGGDTVEARGGGGLIYGGNEDRIAEEGCGGEGMSDETHKRGAGRAKPITAEQKKELIDFFANSFDGWKGTSLPRKGVDLDLDKLLTKLGLTRSQASRQLCTFKKTSRPHLVGFRFDAEPAEIKKNMVARLGGVDVVVESVLDAFQSGDFCVRDALRGQYFENCRDEVRKHVQWLIEALIQAAAESSARSVSAAEQMVTKFAQKRFEVQRNGRTKFLDDKDLCAKVPRDNLHDQEPALLFAFLEQQSYETFTEMIADHERPELKAPDVVPSVDVFDCRAGLIYYLTGWLCFKIKRVLTKPGQRDDDTIRFWRAWFDHNKIDAAEADQHGLPTELTKRRVTARSIRYGGHEQLIEYASREAFTFVWGIEATYCKLLTTANLLAFGGDLVSMIHNVLAAHQPTMTLFLDTVPGDEMAKVQSNPKLAGELVVHLLTAYHRMRGRDFVKQLMSNLKSASADQNRNAHRDRMAAISTAASAAAKARTTTAGQKRNHGEMSSGDKDESEAWQTYFEAEEQAEVDDVEPADLLPPVV